MVEVFEHGWLAGFPSVCDERQCGTLLYDAKCYADSYVGTKGTLLLCSYIVTFVINVRSRSPPLSAVILHALLCCDTINIQTRQEHITDILRLPCCEKAAIVCTETEQRQSTYRVVPIPLPMQCL